MARRWAFAGQQVHLVVAVEMDLVGRIAKLLSGLEFIGDVRVACCGDKRWEPVQTGHNPVFDLARRYLAGPADDGRNPETALERRSLATGKGCLATVGPSEVLSSVVGREGNDGVLVQAIVLHIFHDRADDVVELSHAGFLFAPAIFRVAHGLVLVGEMRHDVHAGRVQPEEERLACRSLALSRNLSALSRISSSTVFIRSG